jgi:hypothetical protein
VASALTSGLKRFVLWDYPRGGRHYDAMVILILAFVFLTPREWFRDQPRVPKASTITPLPLEYGSGMYFIDPELLSDVPEDQRLARLTEVLQKNYRINQPVLRLQPIVDEAEHELKGYVAFTNP